MKQTEKVLCIKKEDILAVGVVPEKNRDSSTYNSSLVLDNLSRLITIQSENPDCYVERSNCEYTEGLIQIIPYVVYIRRSLLTNSITHVLNYTRSKGGDPRLVSKRSIGFGGHVNSSDIDSSGYISGMIREQVEEVSLPENLQKASSFQLHDYIYVPGEDMISKVHLGMLYTCQVTAEEATQLTVPNAENENLINMSWLTYPLSAYLLDNKHTSQWEVWSVEAWKTISKIK